MSAPAYKRILLKLSGEALMGDDSYGINREVVERIVAEIAEVLGLGVEVAIVIGGGNIFSRRGAGCRRHGSGDCRLHGHACHGDECDGVAGRDEARRVGCRVQSALSLEQVAEPFIRGKALRYLEDGKVVIFAAGIGSPFFTTDTAAALRGVEMSADVVIKATKVDGVYTADPKENPAATRYESLSFDEAIGRNLKVMDATALTLCRDQKLPIIVFSIFKPGALKRVVMGEGEGTLVRVD